MIREINIVTTDGQSVFRKQYAEIPDLDVDAMFKTLIVAAKKLKQGEIERTDIVRYRFVYSLAGNVLFFLILDRANTDEEADRAVKSLADMFFKRYMDKLDALTLEELAKFEDDTKLLLKMLPVKLSFAGFGGVGKTTMTKMLRVEEVPLEYVPTIFGSRRPLSVAIRDYAVIIFDFAGQERFMKAWDILVKGAEVVLIVTDSTNGNIMRTQEMILPLILQKAPNAKLYVIANKQDLDGALSPEQVSKILGYPTFGLVAIDPTRRERLLEIIENAIMA